MAHIYFLLTYVCEQHKKYGFICNMILQDTQDGMNGVLDALRLKIKINKSKSFKKTLLLFFAALRTFPAETAMGENFSLEWFVSG